VLRYLTQSSWINSPEVGSPTTIKLFLPLSRFCPHLTLTFPPPPLCELSLWIASNSTIDAAASWWCSKGVMFVMMIDTGAWNDDADDYDANDWWCNMCWRCWSLLMWRPSSTILRSNVCVQPSASVPVHLSVFLSVWSGGTGTRMRSTKR